MDSKEFYERFLEYRGIEKPCENCRGIGRKAYPSTSTWRGGMGGSMITFDVCDKCWGSGDANEKWVDLRKLSNQPNPHDVRLLFDTLHSAHSGIARMKFDEFPFLRYIDAKCKFVLDKIRTKYGFDEDLG